MPSLCILPDDQNKIDLRHLRHQPRAPGGRTLPSRRQVATLRVVAGKTEAHRYDGEVSRIVKLGAIHAEPLAQSITRPVVEGKPRFVNTCPRRLPRNQYACLVGPDQDGTRFMRQWRARWLIPAHAASADTA